MTKELQKIYIKHNEREISGQPRLDFENIASKILEVDGKMTEDEAKDVGPGDNA